MRQGLTTAEFIYILNGYNGYLWDFPLYLVEWYKRDQNEQIWRIYMSKLTQVIYTDLPDYTALIADQKPQKDTKADIERLIKKVNKANGGGKK